MFNCKCDRELPCLNHRKACTSIEINTLNMLSHRSMVQVSSYQEREREVLQIVLGKKSLFYTYILFRDVIRHLSHFRLSVGKLYKSVRSFLSLNNILQPRVNLGTAWESYMIKCLFLSLRIPGIWRPPPECSYN